MKKLLFICLLFCNQLTAQNIAQLEDEIKKMAYNIVNGETYSERVAADSAFTKGLVRALKTPFSFNHRFDSLITVSTLFSPDSTFKVFTWQLLSEATVKKVPFKCKQKMEVYNLFHYLIVPNLLTLPMIRLETPNTGLAQSIIRSFLKSIIIAPIIPYLA
jgi:hypothetical protein